MTRNLASLAVLVAALTCGISSTASAQTSDEAIAQAPARFRAFDANGDGQIAGREIDACACRKYDTDGDGVIAKGEFYAGFLIASYEKQGRSAASTGSADAALPAFKVRDRVEWKIGDTWYKGRIYNAQDGRYQIDRDDFGPAREWVMPSDLRALPGTTPARPSAAIAPASPSARPAAAPAAAPGVYAIGDRVEWHIGDIWYKGTIAAVENGRYQIDRDGYGRTSDWVLPADLRRLAPAPAVQPAPPGAASQTVPAASAATPAAASRYRPGDRVEINVNRTWYAASIANAQNDRYRVMRDDRGGVSSSDEWVSVDRLRPLAAKASVAAAAAGPLPGAMPLGVYVCTLSGLGNTGGKLRIINATTSSGVTPDASGAQYQFAYDRTTGAITWPRGLPIAGVAVERAEYRPTAKGVPTINLHYRRTAGANLNSMGCVLE